MSSGDQLSPDYDALAALYKEREVLIAECKVLRAAVEVGARALGNILPAKYSDNEWRLAARDTLKKVLAMTVKR